MTTITKPAALNFLGATARILASGGGSASSTWTSRPARCRPLHVHHNEDEGFYVLGGELTLYLPGESVTLRAGDFFLAPRGVPHAYEVGPDGARTLVSSAPSGFERFVTAVAALDEVDPGDAHRASPPSTASRSSALPARGPSQRAPASFSTCAAAKFAAASASAGSAPRSREASQPAVNASPAPVESTCAGAGLAARARRARRRTTARRPRRA